MPVSTAGGHGLVAGGPSGRVDAAIRMCSGSAFFTPRMMRGHAASDIPQKSEVGAADHAHPLLFKG